MKFDIKPLKTKKDYRQALEFIDQLIDSKKGTKEYDLLDIVSTLVEAYENEHYPIDPPYPVEAIKFRMEQLNLRQADIAALFGGKTRVSEILRGVRSLTLRMIYNLNKYLKIPFSSLIKDNPKYKLDRKAITELQKKPAIHDAEILV